MLRQQGSEAQSRSLGLVSLDGHDDQGRRACFPRQADGHRDLPLCACRGAHPEALPLEPRRPRREIIDQGDLLPGLK